jgi:hypothetical protein
MQEYAIDAQYMIYMTALKRLARGILQLAKGDSLNLVHSDQLVLGTVRCWLDLMRDGQRHSNLS